MSRSFETVLPHAALALFVVVLLVATVSGATTSPTAYSAYNRDWDGTSDFRTQANAATGGETVAFETAAYDRVEADSTVAIVIAPTDSYSAADLDTIEAFVLAGGTLVVAADFAPEANRLLAGVGATARIDGRPLRDERSFYRTAALPVVRDVRDDPLTRGVDELTLNHPTAVEPNDAQVLAATTGFAYIDAERNAELDLEEEMRSYPVVTAEPVGDGRVVTISDPSLFLNGMRDRSDNARFVDGLTASRDDALLDFTHGATVPPFVVLFAILREELVLQALVVGAGVVAIGLWVFVPGLGGRLSPRPDRRPRRVVSDVTTLRASLRRAHPDWDDVTVDRVATVVSRRVTDTRRERGSE